MAGRPRKEIDDIVIDGWTALEIMGTFHTAEECAEIFGMSVDTLGHRIEEKYGCNFSEFRKRKRKRMRNALKTKQFTTAMEGSVPMQIWLGKQYLGQSDKKDVNHGLPKSIEQIVREKKENAVKDK